MGTITGTSYDNIYDLFLLMIDDYELTELYNADPTKFFTFLHGLLMLAIPDFSKCKKDLSLRDNENSTFLVTLNDVEINILAKLMTKYWLKRKIQDITQMQVKLNDRDFSHFSEAQNLTAKREYYNIVTEECDRIMSNYGYENAKWLNSPYLDIPWE